MKFLFPIIITRTCTAYCCEYGINNIILFTMKTEYKFNPRILFCTVKNKKYYSMCSIDMSSSLCTSVSLNIFSILV